ncbi:MAG: acetyl-CoA hydrolase/transferase family protein [Rhodothermaceae bacterium]
MALNFISAEEAAGHIKNGMTIGFSGFTPAGAAKAIPTAIGEFAVKEHEDGREFKVGVITGASTGDSLDGALARAEAILFRTPYQSNPDLRKLINSGKTHFFDAHLSLVAQNIRYGFFGKIDFAIVEACDITEQGEIVLTSSVGISPTVLRKADKILIELNKKHPAALKGMHDIYEPADPPHRREIPIFSPSDRAGSEIVKIDPSKIVGIVETDLPDEVGGFSDSNEVTMKIGQNVAEFLANEIKAGRIPKDFLPIQSGVGNVANAVLGAMGAHPDIPKFQMYTEVMQDSVVELMKNDSISFVSSCSMTLSPDALADVYSNLDYFHPRIVLRPQEISNHPEIARRLGIISINTALETDLFGNVNSTNVLGKKMMNGIGGSGDFTRNAYISMFTCPSVAKGGAISAIVPMVSHVDHSEHSVQVLVTEQGVADLRGKSPAQKAQEIINNCVHPDYRDQLRNYLEIEKSNHTPQVLSAAFEMHKKFIEDGTMKIESWLS